MAIQGVIFDLGHTLMHLDGTWPEVIEKGGADLADFLGKAGVGLDGEAFAQSLLQRRRDGYARAKESMREVTAEASMRQTFAQFGFASPDPALVTGAIDAFFAYEESRWFADPDAEGVLRELAGRGMHLGLYSNATDDRFIQRLVDRMQFRPWLEPALSSAGTGTRKPDPAALAPILEAWGLLPSSVAMVGDTLEADILGARRAGMQSVWIRSRNDARQEGVSSPADRVREIVPDRVVIRLKELPGCLADL